VGEGARGRGLEAAGLFHAILGSTGMPCAILYCSILLLHCAVLLVPSLGKLCWHQPWLLDPGQKTTNLNVMLL
jgi:hypothetical protein